MNRNRESGEGVKAAVAACGAELFGTSVIVDDTTAEVRAELGVVSIVASDELGVS